MFQKTFLRLKRWIESITIPRYTHYIGLEPHRFTPSEAQILKDNVLAFKKIIQNKLMVANAASYWNDQKGFFMAKGKVEALEELMRYCDKLSTVEIITDDVIPLQIEKTVKDAKIHGEHF